MSHCSEYDSDGYLKPIYTGTEWVWYKDGLIHRDEKDKRTGLVLPAKICKNNFRPMKEWWKEGFLYREFDLPTKITTNTIWWYNKNGDRHRDHGRPAVIWQGFGVCDYYINGKDVTKKAAKNWWAIRMVYLFEDILDPFALEEFILRFVDIDSELNMDYNEDGSRK